MVDADIEMPGIGAAIPAGRQFGASEFTVAVRPSTILVEVYYRIDFTMRRGNAEVFLLRQNVVRLLQAAKMALQFGETVAAVLAEQGTPQRGIQSRVCVRIADACVRDLLASIILADGMDWNKVS